MIIIEEGKLQFQFPSDWQVCKYDGINNFYYNQVRRCEGTKAVDILAWSGSFKYRRSQLQKVLNSHLKFLSVHCHVHDCSDLPARLVLCQFVFFGFGVQSFSFVRQYKAKALYSSK